MPRAAPAAPGRWPTTPSAGAARDALPDDRAGRRSTCPRTASTRLRRRPGRPLGAPGAVRRTRAPARAPRPRWSRATTGSSSRSARSSIPSRAANAPRVLLGVRPRSSPPWPARCPADSLAYLGHRRARADDRRRSSSRRARPRPGWSRRARRARRAASRRLADVDLERELLPLARASEAAVAVEPAPEARRRQAPVAQPSSPRGSTSARRARRSRALQAPVAKALDPHRRQAPGFKRRQIGDVDRVQPAHLADGRADLRDRRTDAW